MGQVAVNVNGRVYRFDCGDGEEARLEELVSHVRGRIEALAQEYGNVGDDRLILTAALLTADELFDTRAALAEAKAETDALKAQMRRTTERPDSDSVRPDFRRKMTAVTGEA
jgi:cell division protein ZapA